MACRASRRNKACLVAGIVLAACANIRCGEVTLEEAAQAYESSPFAFLSQDYFARFSRDASAKVRGGEMQFGKGWQIVVGPEANSLASLMARDLAEFLRARMNLELVVRTATSPGPFPARTIGLIEHGGGAATSPDSYTISVAKDRVVVKGQSPAGLRDGVVGLVDQIGFRAGPILQIGETVATSRLPVRLGAVTWLGNYRDVAFHGGNAVILTAGRDTRETSYTRLTALSTSRAIAELAGEQDPALLGRVVANARSAKHYGLKTYVALYLWGGYPADAPIFTNHPGLRGAEIYRHPDQPSLGFIPCTEHPLMRQYLTESMRGLFRDVPLNGAHIIIGGEVFQHCFMRPVGAKKGHTNCERCERLGAETVVANLCNYMAEAIRSVNPDAQLIVWPYTATHFWSADGDQSEFITKLRPGAALMTEMEKEETLTKDGGKEGNIVKRIWDYSIDYIGPTPRAQRQIAACKAQGIEAYLKSEPELAFEVPGLPYIPCLDRWYDRAEAMAASGADGAWVFPWFQASYGTSSSEVYKYAWWTPNEGKEATLARLARRIAGPAAADHLRRAWGFVSQAITNSPDLPPYFCGPYFLGPAHPMCADEKAELPGMFQAKSRFGPHVLTGPTCTALQASRCYRRMEQALRKAAEQLASAEPLVPPRCTLTFHAEALPTRWFYHVARTHANFYESCLLREYFAGFSQQGSNSAAELPAAQSQYDRWRAVLADERANMLAAIPVVQQDPRLDVRYGFGGAALAPAPEMMRAKLKLLDRELDQFLPSVAQRCGLDTHDLR